MSALLYTAHKCERYQLRMRTISRSKHTKLNNTKIYSKGILVNHTKISTNENFPLYGIQQYTLVTTVPIGTPTMKHYSAKPFVKTAVVLNFIEREEKRVSKQFL